MRPDQITDEMVAEFDQGVDRETGLVGRPQAIVVRAGMAAALSLPETRAAVLAEIQTEHAAMMAALPGWAEMSDLDKGAALLHIHKRGYEGDEYAVENYPAKYIEDPRLTALDREDACDHAARFEELAEELDGDEHGRLYNLALDHDRSN